MGTYKNRLALSEAQNQRLEGKLKVASRLAQQREQECSALRQDLNSKQKMLNSLEDEREQLQKGKSHAKLYLITHLAAHASAHL